jgi:AbrB family looped-hinge helix DNA binding protein
MTLKDSKREILGMTVITSKFQVTIPKKLRDKHKLNEGDSIAFVEENEKVYLVKSNEV